MGSGGAVGVSVTGCRCRVSGVRERRGCRVSGVRERRVVGVSVSGCRWRCSGGVGRSATIRVGHSISSIRIVWYL